MLPKEFSSKYCILFLGKYVFILIAEHLVHVSPFYCLYFEHLSTKGCFFVMHGLFSPPHIIWDLIFIRLLDLHSSLITMKLVKCIYDIRNSFLVE